MGGAKGKEEESRHLGVVRWRQILQEAELFTFQTEEEASRSIKEKMSINVPSTHGHDIHVTRDLVTELVGTWGVRPMILGLMDPGQMAYPSHRSPHRLVTTCIPLDF